MANNSWSDVSSDILSEVAERLSYFDLCRCGKVCKSWRAVIDEVQRHANMHPLINYSWHEQDGKILSIVDLVDLSFKQKHTLKNILFKEPCFCASKYDWLLFRRLNSTPTIFFFCNPLCNKVMELPPIDLDTSKHAMVRATFTSTPTSPDCIIFVVCKTYASEVCTISTFNLKDRRWSVHKTKPCCDGEVRDLAYVDGTFFCLFHYMISSLILGAFNVARQDWIMMDYSASLRLLSQPMALYMVESDGELLLAAYHHDGKSFHWHIYQFDWSVKSWTRVKSLGNRVVFLGSDSSSIARPALGRASEFANTIVYYGGRNGYKSYTCSKTEGEWRYHQTVYSWSRIEDVD